MQYTRDEKVPEMTRLTYALRNTIVRHVADDEMNIAEAVNAMTQVMASVLVGAYSAKNREVVLLTLPDVIRNYFPVWEKIYAENGHKTEKSPRIVAPTPAQ